MQVNNKTNTEMAMLSMLPPSVMVFLSVYGKIRVSPRIERARVICQRPRKNFGKERAFGAHARHG